tara:strand:+ start:62 stop:928 length:867 start_codon:yes stop_codon:yes gene_type:complete
MTLNLTNGNCLEEMKKIEDKSIDLMICDLPYGETNCKWDIKIDMEEFWNEFKRIRKSKRTACLHFCSTKFGYELIKSWEKGFKMDMIWKKRKPVGGITSRSRPMRNHEMIYFFYEDSPKYNRDKYHKRILPKKPKNCKKQKKSLEELEENKSVEETGKFGGLNNCSGNAFKGKGFNGKTYKEQYGHCPLGFEPRQPSTIIVEEEPVSMFESKKVYIGKRHHPTEKPQDILEFFLKYWSDEGDTVLDPTMGGGSTGVACKKLKRNFIGIELDEKIFEVAKNRIEICVNS